MSETSRAKPIAVEKSDRAIVAQPQAKMMDDETLHAMIRLVDDASAEAPAVPLVVVDLSRVNILPSLALGLLVQMNDKCRARGQRLTLAAVPVLLRRVFAITRLDRVFQFADTVEAAVG